MAVFSTFDPKFQGQILQKSIDEYWEDKVIHIRKSKLFLWRYVILPFSLRFLTFVAVITVIILLIPERLVWLIVTLCGVTFGAWIMPLLKILKALFDYLYDFTLITPQSFIRYDQTWLFKRTSKVIDLTHVRSVSVEKKGFINSIFNNWNLVVLSEWSDSSPLNDPKADAWKIYFRYVKNPEYYSERIEMLLKEINYNDND